MVVLLVVKVPIAAAFTLYGCTIWIAPRGHARAQNQSHGWRKLGPNMPPETRLRWTTVSHSYALASKSLVPFVGSPARVRASIFRSRPVVRYDIGPAYPK